VEARHGGRKQPFNVGEVLDGIFYVLWTGCQGGQRDLPSKSTVPLTVTGTARWSVSITNCTSLRASGKAENRAVANSKPARDIGYATHRMTLFCSGHAQRRAKQNGSSRRVMALLYIDPPRRLEQCSDTSGTEAKPDVPVHVSKQR
jgi:hypothetical protein